MGLVNAMAQHGHASDTIAYLNDPLLGDRFPLDFVNNVARECRDDSTRLGLLRAAARAWKERVSGGGPNDEEPADGHSTPLRTLLDALAGEKARPILGELLEWALEAKCQPRRFPLTGNPADPELASENELLVFQLVPALQALEPELARGPSKATRNSPQQRSGFPGDAVGAGRNA